ncbi:MAG: caspase family protein [Planctomycetota bacterium]
MPERFRIHEEIARDDVSVGYRAFDRQLHREVVLKRLVPEALGDKRLVSRLVREARSIAQVRSPRVVSLYEVGEDREGPYLCLEPLEGESLRARLLRLGPLDAEQVTRIGLDLGEALSAIHRRRLVHANVYPEQVFLEENGHARLTGFTLAHLGPGVTATSVTVGQTLTTWLNAAEAAAPYAPEEKSGHPLDARSDLYALGRLLVHCLVAAKSGPKSRPSFHEDPRIDSLRSRRPDVPGPLEQVLRQAVAEHREGRFASAADFIRALRQCAAGAPLPATGAPPARTLAMRRSRPFALALGAMGAGLALVLALVFIVPLMRSSDGEGARGSDRGASPLTADPTLQPGYAKSHALIVGIDRYPEGSSWAPLPNAVADAEAVRDFLIEGEDFTADSVTVLLREGATRDAIRRHLHKHFSDRSIVGPDDRILFYFAGHGQQQDAPGRGDEARVGYLVPYDGNRDDSSTLILHDDIVSACDLTQAKHVLLLLDCCFSGWAVLRSGPGEERFEAATTRSAKQVLTAGEPGEPVADALPQAPGHSPFTCTLLEGLSGAAATAGRPFITASELGVFITSRVPDLTGGRQHPSWTNLKGLGDFVFRPKTLQGDGR